MPHPPPPTPHTHTPDTNLRPCHSNAMFDIINCTNSTTLVITAVITILRSPHSTHYIGLGWPDVSDVTDNDKQSTNVITLIWMSYVLVTYLFTYILFCKDERQ